MAYSPFYITWALDSHVAVPSTRLANALEQFERSELDFAVPSQLPNSFFCHNFAFVFKWNDNVQRLFLDWMKRQRTRDIVGDDQGTLCDALGCAAGKYGLQFGVISPNWAMAWLSLNWGPDTDNSSWWRHRTTRVISGRAEICHKPDVCQVANHQVTEEDKNKPHVLYMDDQVGISSSQVAFSHNDMNRILPYNYSWNDFDSPQTDIFQKVHYRCP